MRFVTGTINSSNPQAARQFVSTVRATVFLEHTSCSCWQWNIARARATLFTFKLLILLLSSVTETRKREGCVHFRKSFEDRFLEIVSIYLSQQQLGQRRHVVTRRRSSPVEIAQHDIGCRRKCKSAASLVGPEDGWRRRE